MKSTKEEVTMIGYKGFDKDWKCRGMQYKVGESYEHKGTPKLCSEGLHFCENPLDLFGYYDPASSHFAEIAASGVTDETADDSKRVAKKISVKAELNLDSLIKLGVKFILDKVDFKNAKETNTGDRSAATNTGDRSAATNTGDRSAATNTGYQSAATNTGYQSAATNTGNRSAATNTGYQSAATNTGNQSAATNTGYQSAATNTGNWSAAATIKENEEGVAISLGIQGKAQAPKGSWITLAEWEERGFEWHRIDVQTTQVDGKKIKADTFYMLKGGKFVEVK